MDRNTQEHIANQKRILGEFIKSQRKLAQMSLRELAERTNISNPYLSQIERGLHEPSVRILKSLANALNVSASSLLSQLGLAEESGTESPPPVHSAVETSIYSDPLLSQYQKEVLVATYKTFTQSSNDSHLNMSPKADVRKMKSR